MRPDEAPEQAPVYAVEFADPAKAEADAAYLWLAQRSLEFAVRWYAGLLTEAQKLSVFPTRCPLAPENDLFDTEVRQFLYRRGRTVYRLLFFLVDADGDGRTDTVRILHVRHASQPLYGEVGPGPERNRLRYWSGRTGDRDTLPP